MSNPVRDRMVTRHLLILLGVVPLALLTVAVAFAWTFGIGVQ